MQQTSKTGFILFQYAIDRMPNTDAKKITPYSKMGRIKEKKTTRSAGREKTSVFFDKF